MATVTNEFDLPGCLEAAAAIEADFTRLTAALTEAQFHAPTRTGGWSVGFCIEHLVLTGHAFLPKWDKALKDAVVRNGNGLQTFPYAWWQRQILRYAENPSRLRRKTPPAFVPYSRYSIEETAVRFLGMHRELTRRIARCGVLDARRTKVQSPFAAWLRYALGFSFDLVLAHERRHLSQAWRVRSQILGEAC